MADDILKLQAEITQLKAEAEKFRCESEATVTLKLQAEITRLDAEAEKFQREAEEIRWRLRPFWAYGKYVIGAIVAGVTFVYGFYSFIKPVLEFEKQAIAFELQLSKQAEKEAKTQAVKTEAAFKIAQEEIKNQQDSIAREKAEIDREKAELLKTLKANLAFAAGTPKTREIELTTTLAKKLEPKPKARTITPVLLRTEPRFLTYQDILQTIQKHGFSLPSAKIQGDFTNEYVNVEDETVIDNTTGLMWQTDGSTDTVTFDKALDYINGLNAKKFAGHSDWRLPTIEELLSILDSKQKNGILYTDKVFNDRQRWIISADNFSITQGWGLVFYEGKLYIPARGFPYYVRAVRTNK